MDSGSENTPWEDLYRYWLDRHADGKPPSRAAIDPMIDLHHMASNLIVIDVFPGRFEYRLVGSQVVSRFGVDHTGKLVGTSGVDKTQLDAWSAAVEYVANEGKPFMLASHYPEAAGAKVVALLLPLSPDEDGARKLFGATFYDQPFPDVTAYPDLPLTLVQLDV
jgi:hypothetical protein